MAFSYKTPGVYLEEIVKKFEKHSRIAGRLKTIKLQCT